jgi:hypothetical protein
MWLDEDSLAQSYLESMPLSYSLRSPNPQLNQDIEGKVGDLAELLS